MGKRLQRKRGGLGQPELSGTSSVKTKHVAELCHTYPLLLPLKGAIYILALTAMPSIRERPVRDAKPPCFSELSLCPLPVEISRAWGNSTFPVNKSGASRGQLLYS